MKKDHRSGNDNEMLDEYDFRGEVRGKYADRIPKGTKIVTLGPDVAKVFPDSKSVNEALRACAVIIKSRTRKKQSA